MRVCYIYNIYVNTAMLVSALSFCFIDCYSRLQVYKYGTAWTPFGTFIRVQQRETLHKQSLDNYIDQLVLLGGYRLMPCSLPSCKIHVNEPFDHGCSTVCAIHVRHRSCW